MVIEQMSSSFHSMSNFAPIDALHMIPLSLGEAVSTHPPVSIAPALLIWYLLYMNNRRNQKRR